MSQRVDRDSAALEARVLEDKSPINDYSGYGQYEADSGLEAINSGVAHEPGGAGRSGRARESLVRGDYEPC